MCLCGKRTSKHVCVKREGLCYRLVTKAASHTRVLTLFYRGGTGQASATRSYLSCTPLFFFPQPRCREVGLVHAPHQHYLRMLQNRTPACRDRQNMHYKQLIKLVQWHDDKVRRIDKIFRIQSTRYARSTRYRAGARCSDMRNGNVMRQLSKQPTETVTLLSCRSWRNQTSIKYISPLTSHLSL